MSVQSSAYRSRLPVYKPETKSKPVKTLPAMNGVFDIDVYDEANTYTLMVVNQTENFAGLLSKGSMMLIDTFDKVGAVLHPVLTPTVKDFVTVTRSYLEVCLVTSTEEVKIDALFKVVFSVEVKVEGRLYDYVVSENSSVTLDQVHNLVAFFVQEDTEILVLSRC